MRLIFGHPDYDMMFDNEAPESLLIAVPVVWHKGVKSFVETCSSGETRKELRRIYTGEIAALYEILPYGEGTSVSNNDCVHWPFYVHYLRQMTAPDLSWGEAQMFLRQEGSHYSLRLWMGDHATRFQLPDTYRPYPITSEVQKPTSWERLMGNVL